MIASCKPIGKTNGQISRIEKGTRMNTRALPASPPILSPMREPVTLLLLMSTIFSATMLVERAEATLSVWIPRAGKMPAGESAPTRKETFP